jgi:hypothetical protein
LKIVFTGHRDRRADPEELRRLHTVYPDAIWIHGGARGFDTQVNDLGIDLGKSAEDGTMIVVRPEYKKFPGRERAAPQARNRTMVDMLGNGDLLVALFDGRLSGGTFETIKYAESRRIRVMRLERII